ncbi:deoxyribonuclease IV [Cuniculiplasma sp. SKW4]|uniref:deoxyribonuclease IV n=1 Tax=Cuniculiplasma sp. SKW4 TaxID=3400171 RepID=UPI003FD5D02A
MKITETHLIGGHLSTTVGIENTPISASKFHFRTYQIFSKNQMQWKAKAIPPEVPEKFKENRNSKGIRSVMVHASYLLNTASSDKELRDKVREAFRTEIERCDEIGAELLTFHPGSFKEATLQIGIENVAAMLNDVINKEQKVTVLIENSAGQGNSVGKTFLEIGEIIDRIEYKNKVGICLDTCHAWASGYDFTNGKGYESMIDEIKNTVGIEKIMGFHLNDSKKGLGEHTDRHEQIGLGKIGAKGFSLLLNDSKFFDIPMIMETPKGEAGYMDDLSVLDTII